MVTFVDYVLTKLNDRMPNLCRVCAAPYLAFGLLLGAVFIEHNLLWVILVASQWGGDESNEW